MRNLKLFYNKLRILFLKIFTNRVKEIIIKDEKTGAQHKITSVKDMEKICDHKTITEIAPTMWKCANKNCGTFFQINYKVMLTDQELISYLDQISTFLKHDLEIFKAEEENKNQKNGSEQTK